MIRFKEFFEIEEMFVDIFVVRCSGDVFDVRSDSFVEKFDVLFVCE